MYASAVWWGFSNASETQKIFGVIRRYNIHTGFCSPDLADFHDLYVSSDEKLFKQISTPYTLATTYCTKLHSQKQTTQ